MSSAVCEIQRHGIRLARGLYSVTEMQCRSVIVPLCHKDTKAVRSRQLTNDLGGVKFILQFWKLLGHGTVVSETPYTLWFVTLGLSTISAVLGVAAIRNARERDRCGRCRPH